MNYSKLPVKHVSSYHSLVIFLFTMNYTENSYCVTSRTLYCLVTCYRLAPIILSLFFKFPQKKNSILSNIWPWFLSYSQLGKFFLCCGKVTASPPLFILNVNFPEGSFVTIIGTLRFCFYDFSFSPNPHHSVIICHTARDISLPTLAKLTPLDSI